MSKSKDRNKERQKLFKKVRNISSWRRVIVYFVMICLFVGILISLVVSVVEYVYESKFSEGYTELNAIAKLYDLGNDDPRIMEYIESVDHEFIVIDSEGQIVYQKGTNTCSGKKGRMLLENGRTNYTVYLDSENDFFILSEEKNAIFNWKRMFQVLETDDEGGNEIRLPIWASISMRDTDARFVGKMYFTLNRKDTILVVELLTLAVIAIAILIVAMFISIIRSVINYRRVSKLFYSDPITKGHNWTWYLRSGNDRIQNKWNKEDSFAVINLVFRNYRNYCLCHSVEDGAKVLSKIDKVINGELRRYEMCAHATTSNFALLLRYNDAEQLKLRLQGIVKKLQSMEEDHTFDFQVGVDLIVPKQDENGKIVRRRDCDIEDIYNNACAARATLGDSEETGIRFFDNKLLEEQRWHDIVHESQNAALQNEEFVVYYQPKYDPKTNVLRGAEALIRWNSPKFGFVSPGHFIPIFEKNGFITQIDHYMISHVAADQRAWLEAGYQCVPVSVNVSRAHFGENDLAEQIRDIVDAKGCPHHLIEIELTESAFFDDKNAMIETIKRLKGYGFAVSMDDFGAGYSSLNSLKDMPLDVLKLDADFFRGEDTGVRGEIVVAEAIRLAKSLQMRTVAEGVEDKNQVDFLAAQGCDMIQGFYFAKPMPKNEYAARMTAGGAMFAAGTLGQVVDTSVENQTISDTVTVTEPVNAEVEKVPESSVVTEVQKVPESSGVAEGENVTGDGDATTE